MFNKVTVDKVKEYWNKYPCNIKRSSAKAGSYEYFSEIEKEKYSLESHIPKFAEFEKWRGKKVLEIGCGIGTDTINFARVGAEITAVELSPKSLEIARQRAKVYGLEDKIKFYLANAEELSKVVPVESYDLIYSFGVIHHTPHPERVIEQIHRYVHPDTIIKIMVYHRYSWPVFWMLFKGKGAFWKLDELIAKYSESQNCPITYTYSLKDVHNLLKGFNVVDISIEYPLSGANYFRRLNSKFWFFRKLFYPIINFFGKPFGWHLCVTAKVS